MKFPPAKLVKKIIGQKSKGQTLVEVIVALAFFSLAGTAFLAVIVYSLNNATFTRQKTDAAQLARKRLEEIRKVRDVWGFEYIRTQTEFVPSSVSFHRVVPSNWTIDCSSSSGCLKLDQAVNGIDYTSTIRLTCFEVDAVNCAFSVSYFDVQIQVSWIFKGASKTIALNDRLAKF